MPRYEPTRPCIERLPDGTGCPNYAGPEAWAKGRCPDHSTQYQREHASPSSRLTRTARHQRRRRAMLTGPWPKTCHLCGHVIHSPDDLDVDHPVPVAAGGGDGEVRPAQRACNRSRRGTRLS